jgi:hypothetical protein
MGRHAETVVFEVVHTAGDWEGLPAFVGIGPAGPAPWARRWELRSHDGSRLGEYYRLLDALGAVPTTSSRWVPQEPLEWFDATRCVRMRLAMIEDWAGCSPPWLLNGETPRRRPIVRIEPDGATTIYPTLAYASQATDATGIDYAIHSGGTDRKGCRWCIARADDGRNRSEFT